MYENEEECRFKLCTKFTQFVKGKTEDVLSDIFKRYIINSEETKFHMLDIVVTNKSLAETEQWKYRTEKKFRDIEDVKINILSSKSVKYKNIDSYIVDIVKTKNKKDLPNILIVCYHQKRVCQDIVKLIDSISGSDPTYLETNSNKKLKFHISFDEADVNLEVTKKFITKIKKYLKCIVGILFITATPYKKFWEMLSKHGIIKLLNMNEMNTMFFSDFENYMSFSEHNIIEFNNQTQNPLEYIKELFSKGFIDENNGRVIIFAPGHVYKDKEGVGSHEELVTFFKNKNYCSFLMNGDFKGFIYPDGKKIEESKFKNDHNIEGELRDVLVKWCELNPNVNLALTGNYLIERGITFNTTGFNFTHFVLSNYHLLLENRLMQMAGRGTGAKKYVKKMNVFCTSEIKKCIEKNIKNMKDLMSLKLEYYNKTDFENSDKAIPVKLEVHDEEILSSLVNLKLNGKRGYKKLFHEHLVKGILTKKISIFDVNNVKKFNIENRSLNNVRMYKEGDSTSSRRFKNFHDAHVRFNTISQSGNENEYNLDFCKDDYIYEDFTNEKNVMWITYRF